MNREALRPHLVTLFLFSLVVGTFALVWTFPRAFLFLLLTLGAAVAYVRLFRWVESYLKALERTR